MNYKIVHASESLTNVVVGYIINLILVYTILHWLGFEITMGQNATMGIFLAVVAFIRGYFIRRGFNWFIKRSIKDGS